MCFCNPCAWEFLADSVGQHRASDKCSPSEGICRLNRPGMDGVFVTNPLVGLAGAREVRGPPHWSVDAEAQRFTFADYPLDGFVHGRDRSARQLARCIEEHQAEAVLSARVRTDPEFTQRPQPAVPDKVCDEQLWRPAAERSMWG